ncbi:hypothetical protein [uncultured Paracoccus sp.]|nr:hypothetical protein [uncultured Paracoccus sp.]
MAADLGVSYSTVYDWLRHDRLDLILRRLMARDARIMAEAKRART